VGRIGIKLGGDGGQPPYRGTGTECSADRYSVSGCDCNARAHGNSAPTAVPPTQIPDVTIPDLPDLSEKEEQDRLKKLGLQARNVDKCTGSDQGDEKGKKHSVQCQNPAVNTAAPIGTTVECVVRP